MISMIFIEVLRADIFMYNKSFKCTASNKTIAPDFKCFSKSYSRDNSTISIDVNFTRPSYNMKVRNIIKIK